MLGKKLGYLPGERSISRAEKRLEQKGRLKRKRLLPGDRKPDGGIAWYGMSLVQVVSRQVARAEARKRRRAERRAKWKAVEAANLAAVAATAKRSTPTAGNSPDRSTAPSALAPASDPETFLLMRDWAQEQLRLFERGPPR